MRNLTEIASILQQAKINFSYRFQLLEKERMRGLSTMQYNQQQKVFFGASNVIWALEQGILTLPQQSVLCDYLTRYGFYDSTSQLHFTEDVFDEDFDEV